MYLKYTSDFGIDAHGIEYIDLQNDEDIYVKKYLFLNMECNLNLQYFFNSNCMINNQSFQQSVKPSSYKKDLIPKPYRMVAQFQEFLNITTLSQIKKYQGKLKRQLNNTGTGMLRKFKYLSLKDQFLISMRASTYVVVIEHEVQNEKEREKYGILIYQKFWLKVYQMQTKCRLKKKLKQNKEKLLIQKSLIQGEKKEQKIPFLNKLWNLFTGQADKKQQEELKKVSKVSLEQRVTEDEQELENLLPKS